MTRALSRPTIERMPASLRRATLTVCERLFTGGHRAWLVGGSVRDLALEIEPHDADIATAALPEEVEALFERTVEVGKRFGTILVPLYGVEVQVTTFRSEGAYSDGRRPDAVSYGTSLEQDAARRDFTLNAVYLDPRTDEIADPEGGLADLAAGVLRCVGDPLRRFAEDGLRLLRMARFAAGYELEVEARTLAAARETASALDGVSRERIRAELEGLARSGRPARGLDLLAQAGVWEHMLPLPAEGQEAILSAVERLGPHPGLALLLALLLTPGDSASLAGLRPSRELEREVLTLWQLTRSLDSVLERGEAAARSECIRLLREPLWPATVRLCEARAGRRTQALTRLLAFAQGLGEGERHPVPFLTSRDLASAGIEPGPSFGTLLREAEDLQLGGVHLSRAQALDWLRSRA